MEIPSTLVREMAVSESSNQGHLEYPASLWTAQHDIWASRIVYQDDRTQSSEIYMFGYDEATSVCAQLETGSSPLNGYFSQKLLMYYTAAVTRRTNFTDAFEGDPSPGNSFGTYLVCIRNPRPAILFPRPFIYAPLPRATLAVNGTTVATPAEIASQQNTVFMAGYSFTTSETLNYLQVQLPECIGERGNPCSLQVRIWRRL